MYSLGPWPLTGTENARSRVREENSVKVRWLQPSDFCEKQHLRRTNILLPPEYCTLFFWWERKSSKCFIQQELEHCYYKLSSQTNSPSLCCQNSSSPGQFCLHSLTSQILLGNLLPGCQQVADWLSGVVGLFGLRKPVKLCTITGKAHKSSMIYLNSLQVEIKPMDGPGRVPQLQCHLRILGQTFQATACLPNDPRSQTGSEMINRGTQKILEVSRWFYK
jgi:hypothetical protein